MKQTYVVLASVLIGLIIGASAYGAYNITLTSQPSPSVSPTTQPTSNPTSQPTTSATNEPTSSPTSNPTSEPAASPSPTPAPTSITVQDARGDVVIPLPLDRIVSTESGMTEIICALGGENKIVGILSASVNWPKSVNSKPACGSTSSMDINLEVLIDMNPQLVVMSNSTSTSSALNVLSKLEELGIPVYLDTSNTPDRVQQIVTNFGKILGNETMANTINSDIQYYTNLIQQRLQNVTPTRFLAPMGYGGWNCYGSNSQVAKLMISCGGVNLFTNNSGAITPEAAAQLNPDVMIVMCSGITNNVTTYQSSITDITSRVAFSESNAVKNGRVYSYNNWISGGIEYPLGALCFAKWLHPELFTDIDPAAIYIQLIQKYFGVTPTGVYYYPY